jgi:hypothetical protein
MKLRKPPHMASGRPAMEAAVVASMAPIIQASGSPAQAAAAPPTPPSASASATRQVWPQGELEGDAGAGGGTARLTRSGGPGGPPSVPDGGAARA